MNDMEFREFVLEQMSRLSDVCISQFSHVDEVLPEGYDSNESDAYRKGLLFANERIIAAWKALEKASE